MIVRDQHHRCQEWQRTTGSERARKTWKSQGKQDHDTDGKVYMAKVGRPRKVGERYPSGDLKRGRPRKQGDRYPSGKLKPVQPAQKRSIYDILLDPKLCLRDKLMYGMETAAVYVICASDFEVKIGASKDVGARSRALQTSNSRELNIYWAVRFAKNDAFRLERQIHKDFRGSLRHIRGEHYLMSGPDAVVLIKHYARKLQLQMLTDYDFGYGETRCKA